MTAYLSDEIDEVVTELVAVRHMLDELCEMSPPADKEKWILQGGLQRAAWYTMDKMKDRLEAISEALFTASTQDKEKPTDGSDRQA